MTADITFGFSSYSFHSKLSTGEMTLPQVIDWVAASEGEHLELAALGDDPDSPIPNGSSSAAVSPAPARPCWPRCAAPSAGC